MDLAESFETPDDQTYVFKIRPGVKIAPNDLGVPERDLDGEDVKATFERLKTDSLDEPVQLREQVHRQRDRVEGDTVTVKTTEPYAWFIARISCYLQHDPAARTAGRRPRRGSRTAGAGAGPYRLRRR